MTSYLKLVAIRSFRNSETEALFTTGRSRRWRSIEAAAFRKLDMLNAATVLEDLRSPPGNRLEKLSGNRAGQHSIRVNMRWRLCFRWTEGGVEDVELVDYH
jgi:proteic killer suppression protein